MSKLVDLKGLSRFLERCKSIFKENDKVFTDFGRTYEALIDDGVGRNLLDFSNMLGVFEDDVPDIINGNYDVIMIRFDTSSVINMDFRKFSNKSDPNLGATGFQYNSGIYVVEFSHDELDDLYYCHKYTLSTPSVSENTLIM